MHLLVVLKHVAPGKEMWETQLLSQGFCKIWNCQGGGRALNGSFLLVAAVRLSLAAEQQVIQLILAMFFSG